MDEKAAQDLLHERSLIGRSMHSTLLANERDQAGGKFVVAQGRSPWPDDPGRYASADGRRWNGPGQPRVLFFTDAMEGRLVWIREPERGRAAGWI